MYLVDTNILSQASPTVKVPFSALVEWLDSASAGLFLSAITVTEVVDGICRLEREGASRKAAGLREWWMAVEHLYGATRILSFDLEVAAEAGRLTDRARGAGVDPGFADVGIAATARVHALTILTRNTRDFKALGIDCINPYEALPPLPQAG